MREFCLDEGTLQSFFDGELSPSKMEQVASHLSTCADCAADAREVEQESAMLAAAFEPELSLNVPSERLRARLDAAIADLQPQQQFSDARQGSRLRTWLTGFASIFNFAPQHAVGFASIVAVIAFAAIFSIIYLRRTPTSVGTMQQVAVNENKGPVITSSPEVDKAVASNSSRETINKQPESNGGAVIAKVSQTTKRARTRIEPRSNNPVEPAAANLNKEQESAHVKLLPGEKNYLKAIDSLTTAINQNGEDAMKPTLRAEYQRNLEIVDRAIAASRLMAQKNPNDPDAADLLLTAYQSKVDLLNVVAEQQARLSPIER
ncbi:MAG: zf-HC2 domain-containing protein [Pyrinomonadaceae bacterium]